MKHTFQFILIFSFLMLSTSCRKNDVGNQDEPDLLSVDLSGEWEGYGYSCTFFQELEIIEITQNGTSVNAIKTIGDACVTKGNVTFQGVFSQNPFNVSFSTGSPTQPNCCTIQAEMELITPNILKSDAFGIFYIRKRTYYP